MGLFDRKVREAVSTLTEADFKEWRKKYRRATQHDVRLPIFGTKTAYDVDYTTDVLRQREDFASFLKEVSHGSKVVAVRISYTDCDGYSGERWAVIPATLTAYRGLERSEEESSDGTFSMWPCTDAIVFGFAPQYVRDRIALGQ